MNFRLWFADIRMVIAFETPLDPVKPGVNIKKETRQWN